MTKFEVGKKYIHNQMKQTGVAICIAITSKGVPILEWCHSGNIHIDPAIAYWTEYKEPKRGTVWVNVYDNNKYNDCRGSAFETKKAADLSDQLKIRIACVEVPWVEGQGLD